MRTLLMRTSTMRTSLTRATLLAITAAAALAGCATTQERAASMQVEMDTMMQIYGPACVRLGYASGSDRWRDCVLQLSAKEEIKRYGMYPSYYAYYGHPWGRGWGAYW